MSVSRKLFNICLQTTSGSSVVSLLRSDVILSADLSTQYDVWMNPNQLESRACHTSCDLNQLQLRWHELPLTYPYLHLICIYHAPTEPPHTSNVHGTSSNIICSCCNGESSKVLNLREKGMIQHFSEAESCLEKKRWKLGKKMLCFFYKGHNHKQIKRTDVSLMLKYSAKYYVKIHADHYVNSKDVPSRR